MSEDCLVEKFKHYRPLTAAEVRFLAGLQTEDIPVRANKDVIVQGERSDRIFVLRHGWAYSHKLLPGGQRQVLDFHLPGDFLGIREFAFDEALNHVTTCSKAVICPFPKNRFQQVFKQLPDLTATLFEISTREQAVLVERIVNLGSRTAIQRVAHLFMELAVRLRIIGAFKELSFEFPLSHGILADALGLTRPHVTRMLRQLRESNLLEVSKGRATVLDETGLMQAAEFEEFYLAKVSG